MRRAALVLALLSLPVSVTACTSSSGAGALTVSAASSLTEAFTVLADTPQAVNTTQKTQKKKRHTFYLLNISLPPQGSFLIF